MNAKILSEKRMEILELIDKYGILTRKQIVEHSPRSIQALVDTLKKLEELGLIKTYKLARVYAHYITKQGSEFVGINNRGYTAGSKAPNLATLSHNLSVNDCVISVLREHQNKPEISNVAIISEREILSEKFQEIDSSFKSSFRRTEKLRIMNRTPDFILSFTNKEGDIMKNAYEVELSQKNKTALTHKLQWYIDEQVAENIDNVIYLYTDERIHHRVSERASELGLTVFFEKIETEVEI